MNRAEERYDRAYGAFAAILPGDRVRIVEEFTVTHKWDGLVLKYDADCPEALPEGATGWEYWPTDHITNVTVLGTDTHPHLNDALDAEWSEFYLNDRNTLNRHKVKSSFAAGWDAAMRQCQAF